MDQKPMKKDTSKKRRDDIKEMCKDMLVWKRYVERDCHIERTRALKEMKKSVKQKRIA